MIEFEVVSRYVEKMAPARNWHSENASLTARSATQRNERQPK